MILDKIFDDATKKYGGYLNNRTPQTENLKKRFDSLLKIYAKDDSLLKPFPKIIFDFVDNPSFNAFAKKHKDYYIIGINFGVVLIINDLFNRILSHPEIKNNVGDSSEEKYDYLISDYFTSTNDMVNNGHNGKYKFHVPKNDIRKNYAIHLIDISLQFIFEHELSHILFGHVDFTFSKYGVRRLSESSIKEFFRNNLDLQTLEMDADCTALARCCNFGINTLENPQLVHPKFQNFFTNKIQILSDIDFALSNVLLLFGDRDYYNTTPGKSSHPDPRIRHLMISATFEVIIQQWNLNLNIVDFRQALLNEFYEANRAYQILTKNKINKDVFKNEYYAHHPLGKKVLENWKDNIRDKLLSFTYKPLAN